MTLYEGVMAAAVTPRQGDSYEANLAGFLEVVDFLGEFDLDGLVVLGTTGEMVHFDVPERVKILEFAMKRAKIPVIAGVTHSTLEGTVELAQHAVEIGCAGLAVMPPYYFRYGQEEIKMFYREIARRVGVEKPILIYNIPAFTNPIDVETVRQLFQEGAAAGIKDSSGDRQRLAQFVALRDDLPFHLVNGDDRLLFEAKRHPGVGCISGIASAVPEIFVALDRAMRCDQDEMARKLDGFIQEFCNWFDEFPNAVAVKEAVAIRRRIPVPPAIPLSFERQQKLEEFRRWFEGWLPGVQSTCGDLSATKRD